MPRLTESRAKRATLPEPPTKYRFEYCSEITGFRCRIMASGVRTYVVVTRVHGKEVSVTLGDVGVLSCEGPNGAAELAKTALNAARRGEDPKQAIGRAKRPQGATLAELWKAYGDAGWPLLNAIGTKRASSIKADAGRWRKHFTRIADEPAAAFDVPRTQRWMDTIAGLGARSHALIMLKGLLSFGASRGLNEPHKITLTARPSRKVQNFLKPNQLMALDATLQTMAAEQPRRVLVFALLRLLLHTGCRKSELLTLRCDEVDLDGKVIHLREDKASGENVGRDVHLSDAAVEILRGLPRLRSNPHVFFASTKARRGRHMSIDLRYPLHQALERTGLRRVRLHDLRHSYASTGIGEGVSLHVVGKLLGHKDPRTSARYAHLAAEAERKAIEKVAGALS